MISIEQIGKDVLLLEGERCEVLPYVGLLDANGYEDLKLHQRFLDGFVFLGYVSVGDSSYIDAYLDLVFYRRMSVSLGTIDMNIKRFNLMNMSGACHLYGVLYRKK